MKNLARALSTGQKDSARKIQQDVVRQSGMIVNALDNLTRAINRGSSHDASVKVRVASTARSVVLQR